MKVGKLFIGRPLKGLQSLNLINTRVTDAGLMELATLKSINTLELSGTQVTNAGIKNLQKELPNWKILEF